MGFLGSRGGGGGREEKKGVPPGEIPPIYLLTNIQRYWFVDSISLRNFRFAR